MHFQKIAAAFLLPAAGVFAQAGQAAIERGHSCERGELRAKFNVRRADLNYAREDHLAKLSGT